MRSWIAVHQHRDHLYPLIGEKGSVYLFDYLLHSLLYRFGSLSFGKCLGGEDDDPHMLTGALLILDVSNYTQLLNFCVELEFVLNLFWENILPPSLTITDLALPLRYR